MRRSIFSQFVLLVVCLMCSLTMAQTRLPKPTNLITMPAKEQPKNTQTASQKTQRPANKQVATAPRMQVVCPDTVIIGRLFRVEYKLEANNWRNCYLNSSLDFEIHSKDHTQGKIQRNGQNISTLTMMARMEADVIGDLTLPAMEVDVSGKHYTSPTKHIVVLPNPKYKKEYICAVRWLGECYERDSIRQPVRLKVERQTEDLVVFNGARINSFVMIATYKYWQYLFNPVLAYSTHHVFFQGGEGTQNIMNNYVKQLHLLSSIGESFMPIIGGSGCTPLLGELQWGQDEPYNQCTPKTKDGQPSAVGCVPVAVSQILRFYSYPNQPSSNAYYMDSDKQIYSVEYHTWKPQWSLMPSHCQEPDSFSYKVASAMAMVGMGLNARYGEKATGAHLNNVKPLMCTNFGYSSRMRYYSEAPDSLFLNLLHSELNKGRPCVVSSGGHAFVVDGYNREFVHFNLGWSGYCNGWYQPCIVPEKSDTALGLIKSIVMTIIPRNKIVKQDLNVRKAGQLATLLPMDELQSITHLRISGNLNGEDIYLLRKMAGAPNVEPEEADQWGNLCFLDMENAQIVAGKEAYLIEHSHTKWTYQEGHGLISTYDLHKKLSEREWRNFKAIVGKDQPNCFYERLADGTIMEHRTTEKDIIGPFMFAECTSLQHVVLPTKLKAIQQNAFSYCSSLRYITIPKQVNVIEKQAFSYCTYLEQVKLQNPKTRFRLPNLEECSPVCELQK